MVFPAKENNDGSYSITLTATRLVGHGFVDFYDDAQGTGYQRKDNDRERRAMAIAEYIKRCQESSEEVHLGDLTANARTTDSDKDGVTSSSFKPFGEDAHVGLLTLHVRGDHWLAVIDGSTRLRGIEKALEDEILEPEFPVDIRLFVGLSFVQEIGIFLLINEKQKKARTDLSVRVVQRLVDEQELSDEDSAMLTTVVPDTDKWSYEASRIANYLNNDKNSPWRGFIQQPNESESKPLRLQAFWTSLKGLLNDDALSATLQSLEEDGSLRESENGKPVKRDEFLRIVLKNFWNAVADANKHAHAEPMTTLLWGAVGVNAMHDALTPILDRILTSPEPDVSKEYFAEMMKGTTVEDYNYWFTRKGERDDDSYPTKKGDAVKMIGASGYKRLARVLNLEFRKNLKLTTTPASVRA